MKTHGIVINTSFSNKNIFKDLKIIGQRQSSSNPWTLYKIDFSHNTKELTEQLQNNLLENFYFHYYTDKKVVVVFSDKIFVATHNKRSWKEFIAFGVSKGIPIEQLNLMPSNFEEENY